MKVIDFFSFFKVRPKYYWWFSFDQSINIAISYVKSEFFLFQFWFQFWSNRSRSISLDICCSQIYKLIKSMLCNESSIHHRFKSV